MSRGLVGASHATRYIVYLLCLPAYLFCLVIACLFAGIFYLYELRGYWAWVRNIALAACVYLVACAIV